MRANHWLCNPGDTLKPDYFSPPTHGNDPVLAVLSFYKDHEPMPFVRAALGEPWVRV